MASCNPSIPEDDVSKRRNSIHRRNKTAEEAAAANLLVDDGTKRRVRAPQKLFTPLLIDMVRTMTSSEVTLALRRILCSKESNFKS